MQDKKWLDVTKKYRNHIRFEKRLSGNTVISYMSDIDQFADFIVCEYGAAPGRVTPAMIQHYLASLYDLGAEKTTQARMLSAIRSLFNFLTLEDLIDASPAEFIEAPKSSRKLPDVLSIDQIDRIIETFDRSDLGIRNAAMIEVMYSCGLRVSELVNLRLSDLFFDDGFIRVVGKGDKQRLVPISSSAQTAIERYLTVRNPGANAIQVFLSNRGKILSRVMVFMILKEATLSAGITATVSPHTMRHSFATHLIEGGASIRQVQEMLGHESILTTEIYTHLDATHLRKTIDEHHPLGKLSRN